MIRPVCGDIPAMTMLAVAPPRTTARSIDLRSRYWFCRRHRRAVSRHAITREPQKGAGSARQDPAPDGHCQRRDSRTRYGFVANSPVDLDQCLLSGICATCKSAANREPDMGERSEPKRVCRRNALALFGYAAALGFVASPAILMVSHAGAQTSTPPTTPATPSTETPKSGTERRQERRTGRTERRQERRTARTKRREERRTGREERRDERRDGTAEQKK